MPLVHRGLLELIGVHLAQALVALRFLEPHTSLGQSSSSALVLSVGVGVDVLLHAPFGVDEFEPMQWWHGRENPARLDHRSHVLEEQRRQQRADVCTIGVGIGHEDDLAVPSLVYVEGLAGTGTNHLDDRRTLGVLEHGAKIGLLHVEDFSPDGQQGLKLRVPCHVGRPQGRITLDDEQLGEVGIGGSAVLEFGRQVRGLQGILASLVLLVRPSGDSGARGIDDLLHDGTGHRFDGCLARREEFRHLGLDDPAHDPTHRRGAEHFLGLPLELRFGQTHGDDCRQPFQDVVLDDVIGTLEQPGALQG